MKESVQSILISTEGEFILQKRDNKPGIGVPGKVVNFGGSSEFGETPLQAIAREIREELCIKLLEDDFKLVGSFVMKSSLDGEDRLRYVFVARNIKKADLILKEGEAIVFAKTKDDLEKFPLSEGTKIALDLFYKSG